MQRSLRNFGTTGLQFKLLSRVDLGPFLGRCAIASVSAWQTRRLWIDRRAADPVAKSTCITFRIYVAAQVPFVVGRRICCAAGRSLHYRCKARPLGRLRRSFSLRRSSSITSLTFASSSMSIPIEEALVRIGWRSSSRSHATHARGSPFPSAWFLLQWALSVRLLRIPSFRC